MGTGAPCKAVSDRGSPQEPTALESLGTGEPNLPEVITLWLQNISSLPHKATTVLMSWGGCGKADPGTPRAPNHPLLPGLVDEASLYTEKQQGFERMQKKTKGEGRQHDRHVGFALHNPLGSSSEALKSWGIWSAQAVPELLILGVTRHKGRGGSGFTRASSPRRERPHRAESELHPAVPPTPQPPPPPKLRATIEPTEPRRRQEH